MSLGIEQVLESFPEDSPFRRGMWDLAAYDDEFNYFGSSPYAGKMSKRGVMRSSTRLVASKSATR